MSTEQKAKAYDEALERYKAKQEYESKEVRKFIEYIFPELVDGITVGAVIPCVAVSVLPVYLLPFNSRTAACFVVGSSHTYAVCVCKYNIGKLERFSFIRE